MESLDITPEMLLQAYAVGVFPMAEDRDDQELFWLDPKMRGIIPFESFHIPRRLKKTIRQQKYNVTFNVDFSAVMAGCAEETESRPQTWINDQILSLYTSLHIKGRAHSVEVWDEDRLVGGLYGIALGGAFFGESMFSRARDTSKIGLVHMMARLNFAGFTLMDTQFLNDHLMQFGAIEIPRDEYKRKLEDALCIDGYFADNYKENEVMEYLQHLK